MGLVPGGFQEVPLTGLGRPVGLCGDEWVTQGPRGTLAPLATAPFPGLVTVLEFAPHAFPARLEADLTDVHLPVHHAQTFPVLTVTRLGLGWHTVYWEMLALGWVATLRLEEQVKSDLLRLMTEGRSQKNRHQARRLWRQAQHAAQETDL